MNNLEKDLQSIKINVLMSSILQTLREAHRSIEEYLECNIEIDCNWIISTCDSDPIGVSHYGDMRRALILACARMEFLSNEAKRMLENS